MLTLKKFDYNLPKNFIAQKPLNQRDESKLLIFNRQNKMISQSKFYQLPKIINQDYFIIRNNSKVIKARIFGQKETGGKVEIFLLKLIGQKQKNHTWECLTKPSLKNKQKILFNLNKKEQESLQKKIQISSINFNFSSNGHFLIGYITKKNNFNLITFSCCYQKFQTILKKIGHTPLPPYIKTKESQEMEAKYQTIYAKDLGSVAAPTAGLHFTKELEKSIIDCGIKIVDLTLHVGLGTFLPVKVDNIQNHLMHYEDIIITEKIANQINESKIKGKKILAIGTTTLRALESACYFDSKYQKFLIKPIQTSTNIFIYPPFKFKIVDSLITNFHLPKSTLLMLVASFLSQPNTKEKFTNFEKSSLGKIYHFAMANNYRFFSFGDAMLII